MTALLILMLILMGATVAVLLAGVFFMMRGKEADAKRSNNMMMWRVTFQAGVVALLGLMYLITH
jgi:flagellar basal body-associated protein FliL